MEEKFFFICYHFLFGVGVWRAQQQREIGLQGLSGIHLSKGQVKHGREWAAVHFKEIMSKTKLELSIRDSKRLMKCWISQC